MQGRTALYCKASFRFGKKTDEPLNSGTSSVVLCVPRYRSHARLCMPRAKLPYVCKLVGFDLPKSNHALQPAKIKGAVDDTRGELSEEDNDVCPVDCVKEFKTDEEFYRILEKAKECNSLVVVDFYKTSCGSCKYIEKGFAKLCKGSGDQEAPVIFLKHNVMDEYDEPSELAQQLRIKAVPLFQFYKDGVLLESFPTRDKDRIVAAIGKYSSSALGGI